ncbi:uncharacterized protein LOC110846463 [Folsomia candida]|uniref:Uncharacterized protein n=1 Tax=Folsomia candida TaxID=158441 RepID=A0A226EK32_FOLCA|nr:uncharacterized protein LOC110846463 [Folsomia candida]OXA57364.1 hypothetical protein Fcan01_07588 [Folsomia candida]
MSSYRSHNEKCEIQIPKASSSLVYGGALTFLAGVVLLTAFASPYWLVSWEYTFSPFKKMGLWEFCFDGYRHPNYQFDYLFNGCHWVFSYEFLIIREWLLPGWLMAVQAFMTLALIVSLGTQLILALLVTRWPLQIVLDYEWILTMGSCIGNAICAACILLSISIFGGQYDRRDWLQYPQYNYPSWAYAFAIFSLLVHGVAALILYKEGQEAKERSIEGDGALGLPMHPTGRSGPSSRGFGGGMSNTGSV